MMDTLILTTVYTAIMIPAVALQLGQSRAVTGSAQKFILTTWCITLFAAMAALATIITSMKIVVDDYIFASFWGFIVGMDLWNLNLLIHDDNWFNSQWKKVKKGIKNFRVTPQSLFMPAPAPR